MNHWQIISITFSNMRGYGLHNYLCFNRIPRHQVIGIRTDNPYDQEDIHSILLTILSEPSDIADIVSDDINKGATFCRFSILLQCDNRCYRITRTVFAQKYLIPNTVITLFYEIIDTSHGTKIRLLNGRDAESTHQKILSHLQGANPKNTTDMLGYIIWPDMYYGGNISKETSESDAINLYDLYEYFMHTISDIDDQIKPNEDMSIIYTKIISAAHRHLAALTNTLNQPMLHLQIDDNMCLEKNQKIKHICSYILIEIALQIAIHETFSGNVPNFCTIYMFELWSWLNTNQIDIIFDYLFQYVNHIIIIYQDHITTTDGILFPKLADVKLNIVIDPETNLKYFNYA